MANKKDKLTIVEAIFSDPIFYAELSNGERLYWLNWDKRNDKEKCVETRFSLMNLSKFTATSIRKVKQDLVNWKEPCGDE